MKSLSGMIILVLLFSLLVVACEPDVPIVEEQETAEPAGELSDDEILQQFPDELNEALEELDQVE
ncbi:MAG: hypothetical protein Q8R37_02285 [Nanoarchaeota archaeon]|nr:hypothetical protein [Nanoarchaeota archaeon]